MSGYVYFAAFKPHFIKIGYSTQPSQRPGFIRKIGAVPMNVRVGPTNWHILGVIPGDRKTESDTHSLFAEFRVAGCNEWFHDGVAIRMKIHAIHLDPPPPRKPTGKELIAKAKNYKNRRQESAPPARQSALLAMAWADGGITYTQAQAALDRKRGASVYAALACGLRDAVRMGLLCKPTRSI